MAGPCFFRDSDQGTLQKKTTWFPFATYTYKTNIADAFFKAKNGTMGIFMHNGASYALCMTLPRTAAIGIFVVAILLVIGAYILSQEPPASHENAPAVSDMQESDSPEMTTQMTVTPGPTTANVPDTTRTPITSPTTAATATPLPTQPRRPVEFSLVSGATVNCGLTCRETSATITNTGDETAHSVCVVLEVFNDNGERIFINSAPSVKRCLGDIEGGASKSETIIINADCGFLATKCVGHTLVLKTKATSLEKTQQFPDSLIPV